MINNLFNVKLCAATGMGKTTALVRLLALESRKRKVFFITDEYTYDYFYAKLKNDEILNIGSPLYNLDNIVYLETKQMMDMASLDFDTIGEFAIYDDTMCGHTQEEINFIESLKPHHYCRGVYTGHQLSRAGEVTVKA